MRALKSQPRHTFWLNYAVLMVLLVGLFLVGLRLGNLVFAPPGQASSPIGTDDKSSGGALVNPPFQVHDVALTNQAGAPMRLSDLRGRAIVLFFGYTHCPDVCPATFGRVGEALRAVGERARAVFVTIDPERDTTAWLAEYVRYMPAGFTALTGAPDQIREVADGWAVRYARVDSGDPAAYSMSHTADVFLVDDAGTLRAHFPFGTGSDVMAAAIRTIGLDQRIAVDGRSAPAPSLGPPIESPSPRASPSPSTGSAISVTVVSSSVWAGGPSPIILALWSDASRTNADGSTLQVQLATLDGSPAGPSVAAVAVRPSGEQTVSYVAQLEIPTAGRWKLLVTVDPIGGGGGAGARLSFDVTALDQGATARIGSPAPTAHTPTLEDVGGLARAVTTDPAPDLRLSQRSTTDALAGHTPFVLVADSVKFRVSPACGKAVVLARYLQDRWPDLAFIHLEPYRYSVITDTPVLDGDLTDPPVAEAALAWGLGGAVGTTPWDSRSMPWVFVVDGNGIVRAKYQRVVGSDDVDVILSLLAQGE
jgi:protein SCO1